MKKDQCINLPGFNIMKAETRSFMNGKNAWKFNGLIISALFVGLLFSHCQSWKGSDKSGSNNAKDSVQIIREYYPNKKLKAEISVKDTVRHGLSKTYSKGGLLVSEVMYKNGKRDGKSVNYYPEGGIHTIIFYKDDEKIGESKWFYPSGKVFRVTSYKDGKPDGIQKMYFESGALQAEIPLSNGKICPGLKEYKEDGGLRKAPELVLEPLDWVAMNSQYILKMHLSNNNRNVKYFRGDGNTKGCITGFEPTIPARDGNGTLEFVVLRGQTKMEKLDIIAVETTSYGNQRVIHKAFNLAVKNR